MKSLRFENILIMSEKDERALKVNLTPKTNALVGRNHTGKSTLVRELLHSFGCRVNSIGPTWDSNAHVLVRFQISEINYAIYRHKASTALFDDKDTLIWQTTAAS